LFIVALGIANKASFLAPENTALRRFQFSLTELLFFLTVPAIVFAILRLLGKLDPFFIFLGICYWLGVTLLILRDLSRRSK
jgi:hypothetical protein